ESAASPSGRNSDTSWVSSTRGSPNRSTTRASAAIAATNASLALHSPSASCSFASSKAARAYGRATVSDWDMSDSGYQLVEQRVVRVRIDLAAQDPLCATQGKPADLAEQPLARAVRYAVDLRRGAGFQPCGFAERVLPGLVHDLAGPLVGTIDHR